MLTKHTKQITNQINNTDQVIEVAKTQEAKTYKFNKMLIDLQTMALIFLIRKIYNRTILTTTAIKVES